MSFSYTRKIESEENLSIFIKRQLIIPNFGTEWISPDADKRSFQSVLSW